ncbi:MAG: hypothetical protein Q7J42_17070 [Sulfuritalea sp.]|nr:hypothetical protein [Sulfuritalea sp.]
MMYWLAALAAFSCASSVFALGLGEVEGRAVIGQRLNIAIPILGDLDNAVQTGCAAVLPGSDDDGRDRISIRVEGDRMHLSTSLGLTQPVLQFRVRVGCGSSFERSYVVLSEPPETPVAVSLPRVDTALREEVDTPPVLPKGMPSAGLPSTSGQPGIVLASSTSLRMLSRQRYPGDSRARVRFIRQLAAANPELFASEEAAFDQRLAAGTRLLMPPGLPVLPRAGSVAARAPGSGATRSAPAAPLAVGKPGKATGAGRGRLIVGSAGLSAAPGPSTAELNESIDRLVEVMNQQVLVQIAMTERVKAVEAELAELKRQVAAERVRTAKLEADLKAEREAVERSGTIQLLLAILLGGLAGAWTLSWISRRKESAAVIPLAAVSPAPTPESVQAAPPMPSVFEDMPDEREEILPPAGLRF